MPKSPTYAVLDMRSAARIQKALARAKEAINAVGMHMALAGIKNITATAKAAKRKPRKAREPKQRPVQTTLDSLMKAK